MHPNDEVVERLVSGVLLEDDEHWRRERYISNLEYSQTNQSPWSAKKEEAQSHPAIDSPSFTLPTSQLSLNGPQDLQYRKQHSSQAD